MEMYKEDKLAIFNRVFEIWENSTNKESVERTFNLLTQMDFKFVFELLGKIKNNN